MQVNEANFWLSVTRFVAAAVVVWMDRCNQALLEDEVVLFVEDWILSQFKPIL